MNHNRAASGRTDHDTLRLICGNIIDVENERTEWDDGAVWEAAWDDKQGNSYELASYVEVEVDKMQDNTQEPYGVVRYELSRRALAGTEELFSFDSSDDSISRVIDEEELDNDDEEAADDERSHDELLQELLGWVNTYPLPEVDQSFKDIVMVYAMSSKNFTVRKRMFRRSGFSEADFRRSILEQYPILDEQTVTKGLAQYQQKD